ncbi:glycosyltransferase family 2 protein [Dethiosulfovibrio salsuginis]|uniref:Glycosyltransferase, catalytic subunit of cellulose synthase and poly-beta-1,6-N-acetylglucosamine synthase n=1 Tax=Dethiosulfovibrio salsuginis TaxID=561720 RepID=A0A1X7KPB1_9BACT|nr:glycosyltransferase [Dethiosulfovibrio salsuginis]SMG43408.1 Glycosyltransferase, catalytic subunit of cellulose synthase and poly-beta-1,6-N-acetylglucosamine synthase [Dethiosulfovibrio salsuginis]
MPEPLILIVSMVLEAPLSSGTWEILLKFIPFVLFLEMPVYLLILMGVLKHSLLRMDQVKWREDYYPSVSCLVTCYSEGEDVKQTIRSLARQIYPGMIQIIPIVDGATANKNTYAAALSMEKEVWRLPKRELKVIPKWQRGGRVSALNTGMNFAYGEIVMSLDGDTSFDNDMVEKATRHFRDPSIAAVSGCLRVRNYKKSLVTRLQAIEYFFSIQSAKTGLSAFGIINNISGAFGVFRRSVLELIGGWDAGTAEDLDITLRIKNYIGRYGKFKIVFDPEAMGFTDAPDTFKDFFKQRLRWDGDLSFLYFRKHWRSFSTRLIGVKNFVALLWTGLLFQIVMPVVIVVYTAYLFIAYPLNFVLWILILVYVFYFILTSVFFIIFVTLLSERPGQDLSMIPWLPLMPLFAFATRVYGAFAASWEIFGRGHRDTNMAPWWVTKKSKF